MFAQKFQNFDKKLSLGVRSPWIYIFFAFTCDGGLWSKKHSSLVFLPIKIRLKIDLMWFWCMKRLVCKKSSFFTSTVLYELQLQQGTLLPWAPLYSMAIQIQAQPPAVYSWETPFIHYDSNSQILSKNYYAFLHCKLSKI